MSTTRWTDPMTLTRSMTKDDSMSDFDPDWPHGHVTRDGHKARIICRDAKGSQPLVVLVDLGDREATYRAWLGGTQE